MSKTFDEHMVDMRSKSLSQVLLAAADHISKYSGSADTDRTCALVADLRRRSEEDLEGQLRELTQSVQEFEAALEGDSW